MSISISIMRKIDYFVGVPLCLIGTIVRRLLVPLIAKECGTKGGNVLFVGLSETGSTVLAGPAMEKAKSRLRSNLYYVTFKKNSPVLAMQGIVPVSNVFSIRDCGIAALVYDALRFLVWARKRHIDTVIDLELYSRFSALLAGFSGAGRTAGFHAFYNEGLYRGNLFTHKVIYNQHQHISKNFIALVNALLSDETEIPYSKSAVSDAELVLKKTIVDKVRMDAICGKISEYYQPFNSGTHQVILFNTNASDLIPLRRWPKEHYISLAKALLDQYPSAVIILIGVEAERSWNEDIVSSVSSERCINFAGSTTFAELLALYSVSELLLTNDSGPAHFASLTHLPTFVFFGPETPRLYAPLGNCTVIYSELACSPCVSAANHRRSPCNDNICLQIITPEMVLPLLKSHLDGAMGK